MSTAVTPKAATVKYNFRPHGVLGTAIDSYKTGMQKFVRMFADKHDLQLVFRGTQACTNGKTIVVPELSLLDKPDMTQEEIQEALNYLRLMFGWLCHEAGHIIVDWSFFRSGFQHAEGGAPARIATNALLDCRMEYQVGKLYKGAREAFKYKHDFWIGSMCKKWDAAVAAGSKEMDGFWQVCIGIMLMGKDPKGYAATPLWPKLHKAVRDFLLRHAVEICGVRTLKKSAECVTLAEKLMQYLEQDEKEKAERKREKDASKESPPPPSPTPSDKDADEDTEDEGEEEDEDTEDEGEEDEEDTAGATAEDEDATSDSAGATDDEPEDTAEDGEEPAAGGAGDEDDTAKDEGPRLTPTDDRCEDVDTVRKELEEKAREAAQDLRNSGQRVRYLAFTDEDDEYEHPDVTASMRYEYNTIERDVSAYYGVLERKLRAVLAAANRSFTVGGLEEGELDPHAVHMLAAGLSTKVFREEVVTKNLHGVCVSLLVDRSYSMNTLGKYKLAQRVLLLFARALDLARVPFEAITFASSSEASKGAQKRLAQCPTADQKLYSRFGGLNLLYIKEFREAWQSARYRVACIEPFVANYDGDSVRIATQRLLAQQKPRRVLIVMSDGEPSGNMPGYDGGPHGETREAQAEYLRYMVDSARNVGVEVLGVGITAPECRRFYEYESRGSVRGFVNINNLQEFPTLFVKNVLQQLLYGGL